MMEMATITIPLLLKEQVEEELNRMGMTWNEIFEEFLGKEASPSVDKALKEAYACGMCEKTYQTMAEIWAELDEEEENV